jgi:hypothetical protein
MNEKDKKLIEEIKSSKMPEKEKKHTIAFIRKDRRQREAFMKLSKEERLKALYKQYVGFAFRDGFMFGHWAATKGGIKAATSLTPKEAVKHLRTGLTWTLKEAKVLPLER